MEEVYPLVHRYLQSDANIRWYKLLYTSICKCTWIYTSIQRYTQLIYLGIPRYTQVYKIKYKTTVFAIYFKKQRYSLHHFKLDYNLCDL